MTVRELLSFYGVVVPLNRCWHFSHAKKDFCQSENSYRVRTLMAGCESMDKVSTAQRLNQESGKSELNARRVGVT